jgi:hypothetical protein
MFTSRLEISPLCWLRAFAIVVLFAAASNAQAVLAQQAAVEVQELNAVRVLAKDDTKKADEPKSDKSGKSSEKILERLIAIDLSLKRRSKRPRKMPW